MKSLTKPFVLLIIIALAHMVNDWYSLLIPSAIPLIKKHFTMNYLQSGVLISAPYVIAAVMQSPFAHLSEKYAKRKLFLIVGFLVLSLSYLLFACSNTYIMMFLAAVLIGFGLATYHPQGIGLLSDVFIQKKGAAIGINGMGGALGYLLAPITMGYLLSKYGMKSFFIVMIPGIVIALLIFFMVKIQEKPQDVKILKSFNKNMFVLTIVALILPFFTRGMVAFLPAYFYAKGLNILNANLEASVMLIAGIFAQPLGGFISDKIGRQLTISISYLLMGVFLLLFLKTESAVFLFFTGCFASLSVPSRFALATEISKDSANTSIAIMFSAVMIGASVAPTIIGALVDAFGFDIAFGLNILIAFLGSGLVWLIHKR